MNIKHCSLLLLFTVSRLFLFGQSDSTQEDEPSYKEFYPHSSLWQLSIGANQMGIGSFGRFEKPFHDGYANANGVRVNVNIQFYKPFHKMWSITGGLAFMRNDFDERRFEKSYSKTYGDKIKASPFLYESFALYTGLAYSRKMGYFLLTGSFGGGGLYTLGANQGDGVNISLDGQFNGTGFYDGGTLWVGKSIEPLLFAGLDLKCFLGGDMYVMGSASFIASLVKFKVTENDNRSGTSEHDFLKGYIPFQNLALSIGVGTVFR